MDSNPDSKQTLSNKGIWRTYTTADGLAGLQVEHIVEDQEGYLWFATCSGGVSRFDGDEFRTFTTRDGLCSDLVYGLLCDQQGRLWFGTYDRGVCWYDGQRFHRFGEEEWVSRRQSNYIFEDGEGCIWFCGPGNLGYYDGTTLRDLLPEYRQICGYGPNNCWGIAEDGNGHLWFGGDVLVRYDGLRLHRYGKEDGLIDGEFPYGVAWDADHDLWVGRENRIWRYDGHSFQPEPVEFEGVVRKIQLDREGRMWVCLAGGGAWCYDGATSHHYTIRDGLADNAVIGMLQDREGQFWFATWGGGVSCYDPHSIHSFGKEEELPYDQVYTLMESHQGKIWMGFSGLLPGGSKPLSVGIYDSEDFTPLDVEPEQERDIGDCLVLCEDRSGHLWVGSDNGLFRYDGRTLRKMFSEEGGKKQTVTAIVEDDAGHLFFGHLDADHRPCIIAYDGKDFQTLYQEETFRSFGCIAAIVPTRRRELWFARGVLSAQGPGRGIGRRDERGDVSFWTVEDGLVDDRVLDLLEDRKGILWIATLGGISRFDGHQFQNFTSADGLPNDQVRCLCEDRQGRLWFGTDGGVVVYDGQAFQVIRTERVAPITQIIEDREGRFWFATQSGAVRYRPNRIQPRARILQAVTDRVYRDAEAAEVSTSTHQIAFDYKGMSFRTHPRDMLHTYRLQGYEEEWQPAIYDMHVLYQDLLPGEYTFQVKAIDRDLNYSEAAETRLTVVPDPRDERIDELEERVRERTRELEETHQQLEQAQAQLIYELEEELQTAHDLQMGLMPTESPLIEGLDIAGRCIPYNHVGGDFFQYFQQDGKLSICLADVTGHAMEAAVPVMMFSGVLKTEMRLGAFLDELFGHLNRTMHDSLDTRTYVCFAMGEIDLNKRTLRLANSGCPYPFHYGAATGEVVELQIDAYPLGVRADTVYSDLEASLDPGDYIVFSSDGIIEAENTDGELFGFERTAETIRQGCREGLSAEALIDRLIGTVKDFTGDAPQGDDMTVVVLKVEA